MPMMTGISGRWVNPRLKPMASSSRLMLMPSPISAAPYGR
jgi:hypothetical protein